MKRKYKLLIEIIGFSVLVVLGSSIISDILILILRVFSITFSEGIWKFITFISAFLLGYIFLEYTAWGRDVGKFLDSIKVFKKKRKVFK